VHQVEDWAEVHRLFHRERQAKAVIARQLGMSRNTVARLLALEAPPRYARVGAGSQVDPFAAAIRAMLDAEPEVAATVIAERLRRLGYRGGITILREHVARVRPEVVAAARAFQRTTYEPGDIGQVDWWHTGARIPVGHGVTREAFGLVTSLPWSGAHATVFSLSRTTGDLRPSLLGCLERLGGVPGSLVFDNDASVVASRDGGRARLHADVLGLLGALHTRPIVLAPRRPTSKGHVERTIGYLETSFLPLRTFDSLGDLQAQHDAWVADVAGRRHLRRTGTTMAGGWAVERSRLGPFPDPPPDTDLHLEARAVKGWVRVLGADYSVPPTFAGRRMAIRVTPVSVRLASEGREVAVHRRSFVPADVVLDPAHGRATRLAREARDRLGRGDVELPAVDLAPYDALWEAPA
jgi:transposase